MTARKSPACCAKRSTAPSLTGEAARNLADELARLERLAEDLGRSELGRDRQKVGVADLAAAGDRDDFHVWRAAAELADGLKPLLLGHDDVGDDEIGVAGEEHAKAGSPIGGKHHLITFAPQNPRDHAAHQGIVVNDQYLLHRAGLCVRNQYSAGP